MSPKPINHATICVCWWGREVTQLVRMARTVWSSLPSFVVHACKSPFNRIKAPGPFPSNWWCHTAVGPQRAQKASWAWRWLMAYHSWSPCLETDQQFLISSATHDFFLSFLAIHTSSFPCFCWMKREEWMDWVEKGSETGCVWTLMDTLSGSLTLSSLSLTFTLGVDRLYRWVR